MKHRILLPLGFRIGSVSAGSSRAVGCGRAVPFGGCPAGLLRQLRIAGLVNLADDVIRVRLYNLQVGDGSSPTTRPMTSEIFVSSGT